MTDLRDTHLLVVGATGGLGAALSRRLVQEGARLTLAGRNEDKLSALARELGEAVVATVAADLSVPDGPAAVAAAAVADGGLDGVVYAAGVVAFGPLGELDDDTFDELLLLNFVAPVRLLRSLLPQLNPGSVVVHLSAVVAETPMKGMAAYSASKAALTGFGTAMAAELRRQKIRVLDVRPPHTQTGLHTRPISGTPPNLPEGLNPDAVASRIVAAIADDEASLPSSAFGA
ncbi:SDR family NAD(P)-dependent oxidoreductase [Arthrobacter sp. H35-D1]|uniref:SDR family NAD(P)-dependent oxidoreductase n=1 Tax=Arthrobacter sp. H35-D1 TaxID=3046202 RepID=UPI0024BA0824|nr:SDR family NAD(P)-dependent oxidoreductase [Arthrobacter sp. H35-D1]MDJ0314903.1 SDR family NAD(P)-dependent oxidoreductase [Arthrobacter sp. H35-D1]